MASGVQNEPREPNLSQKFLTGVDTKGKIGLEYYMLILHILFDGKF